MTRVRNYPRISSRPDGERKFAGLNKIGITLHNKHECVKFSTPSFYIDVLIMYSHGDDPI